MTREEIMEELRATMQDKLEFIQDAKDKFDLQTVTLRDWGRVAHDVLSDSPHVNYKRNDEPDSITYTITDSEGELARWEFKPQISGFSPPVVWTEELTFRSRREETISQVGRPPLTDAEWEERFEQVRHIQQIAQSLGISEERASARHGVPYATFRDWKREMSRRRGGVE